MIPYIVKSFAQVQTYRLCETGCRPLTRIEGTAARLANLGRDDLEKQIRAKKREIEAGASDPLSVRQSGNLEWT